MPKESKKRKKNYYKKCALAGQKKRKHEYILRPGLKGFLITCNVTPRDQKNVVHEAYKLLNEYADKLYGEESLQNLHHDESDDGDDCDVEEQVKKELEQGKEAQETSRRIQQADTGAKNCLFFQTTISDPLELVHSIVEDLHNTKTPKSRFIMRLQPVPITCQANLPEIADSAQKLVSDMAAKLSNPVKLMIDVRIRNNSSNTVSSSQVQKNLIDALSQIHPHLVELTTKNPDVVLAAYILKTVCCLSWLDNYLLYKKYNLQEIVTVKTDSGLTMTKGSEAKAKITDGSEAEPETKDENEADDGSEGDTEITDGNDTKPEITDGNGTEPETKYTHKADINEGSENIEATSDSESKLDMV